jgi:hypothetical protein
MTSFALLLAQSGPSAAAPPTAAGAPGGEITIYRFGRLEQFDDPRLLWAGVAIVAASIVLFVAWQYRREAAALPRWLSVVLAGLRLTAFAGAILFFLSPLKRTDRELVTESRVVVLVDASQSMAVEDEKIGDESGVTRSDAAVRALRDSALINQLRQQHEVTLAAFDADYRRLAQWKRSDHKAALGDRGPDAANELDSQPAADGPSVANPNRDRRSRLYDGLKPLGAETRFGDALAAILSEKSGGPLAGIFAFTDGGQNLGLDALSLAEAATARKTPIVTIGVGSRDPRRNARIQELIAPARAFPNDKTIVRALIQAEGFTGRALNVELYARESATGEAAAAAGPGVKIGEAQATIDAEGETIPVEFEIEPQTIGRLELEARLVAPPEDQYADDNRRTAEMEIVETSTKVLLVASGATRDYRFLRDQLRRDKHATVDVLLQRSPSGISQDADKILTAFPSTKEELFEYDCLVAFDADWTQLDAQQVDLLEEWVAKEAGGMIVVAGPVDTPALVQSAEHAKIRALYPVEFQRRLQIDDGLYGSKTPWPIEFTREGVEADFLWLGDTAAESRDRWSRFPGVYGCYAVKGPKPGAQVYGRYSDPDAGIVAGRPVYFADHFYGAGRVFYMGSGELWRLRSLDPGYFERLYTQLVRHVSQGRLLRGSSTGRLLVERDRYFVGDTVDVRAQLSAASREPYVAPRVMARVTGPDNQGRNMELLADENRPGNFVGQFTVSKEGSYRIELPAPDSPDEQLVKRVTATVPDLEFQETRRNEELLTALAAQTGGRYYANVPLALKGDSATPPVAELIPSRAETKIDRGKPDERFTEKVNHWLLAVICGSLSLEWLLRRLMKLA